jgi:hypothetical protein
MCGALHEQALPRAKAFKFAALNRHANGALPGGRLRRIHEL